MSGVPEADGMYAAISDATYHGDKGSLSSSGARSILNCPAKFRYQQDHPVYKDVFDFGTAAHALVLGVGSEIVPIDSDSWRTKSAQSARDDARAAGKVPLLIADVERAHEMADAVRQHPAAAELLASGLPELSGYWHDDVTGVRLRFRPDWMPTDRPICVDYKSTASADPKQFTKSVATYGYHQQAAFYLDGLAAASDEYQDHAFVFICQEKTPPYVVTVLRLDDDAIAEGRRLNRLAINLFAECVNTNTWPGYPGTEGVTLISLPPWALRDGIRADADALIAELEGIAS